MGPFELMDLVGLDVNLAAARGIWEGFGRADRFRPSPVQVHLVEEERLGRKTGRGFYRYEDGTKAGADVAVPGEAAADSADNVATRIELAIIAEAWRALGDAIATADDIDLAMRLGAGHRVGPFERTRELGGADAVVAALEANGPFGDRFAVPHALRESRADR
jgi:3-hydroxybutyryl-CoA dehydrogenase